MYNKIYLRHIYNVYLKRFFYITCVFASLIFIMNILEEIKFFSNHETIGIAYPILLTFLNLPSILFEVLPFIILITTLFFFIKFQDSSEILIFKNNGINNLKIISLLSILTFLIGLIIIMFVHLISSNMKLSYLEFKNKYTLDKKYLAVINENGLWIKDKLDDQIMIMHAENIQNDLLKNIVITVYDPNFENQINIIAKETIIRNKIWEIKNAIVVDNLGKKENIPILKFETNFDYLKINSLFSNLESLNILQLLKQRKDFKSVGLSVLDIEIYLNKILSVPISLVIFSLLSSIVMLKFKINKSKSLTLIIGILMSVIIYYIYYFFSLLGANNQIPPVVAVWMPNLVLFLSCMIGIVNINER